MTLQRFSRRTIRRFGDDISRMAGQGVNLRGTDVNFGRVTDGYAAEGSSGGITVDRNWWKNATRRDQRGLLVHELSHVAGVGGTTSGNWAGNKSEQTADAIRLALVGKYGINQDSLSGARRIANREGWLGDNMATSGNTGPRNGNDSRRNRNTLVNNASRGYQAPASSGAVISAGDQMAAARYQYLSQLAALQAARGGLRQDFITGRADARAAMPGQLAGIEQDATERGVLGSSAELQNRAGVVADTRSQIAALQAAKAQGILGLQSQKLGAQGEYYSSLASIQNSLAQDQWANSISAYSNDSFDAVQQNYQDIIRRLRARKRGDTTTTRAGAGDTTRTPYNGPAGNDRGPGGGATPALHRAGQTWYGKPLY